MLPGGGGGMLPAGSVGLGEWGGPGTCRQRSKGLARPMASHPIFSAGAKGMVAPQTHRVVPPYQSLAVCTHPIILSISVLSHHSFLSTSSKCLGGERVTPAPPPPPPSLGGQPLLQGSCEGWGKPLLFHFILFLKFFFLKLFPHLTNNVFFNFMAAPVAYEVPWPGI